MFYAELYLENIFVLCFNLPLTTKTKGGTQPQKCPLDCEKMNHLNFIKMKNLKRKITMACMAFVTLVLCENSNAQTHIAITQGADYYLCAGTTYIIDINVPSGYCVTPSDWYYGGNQMGNSPPYYVNNLEITGWSNSNYWNTIVCQGGSDATTSLTVYYYDPILCHLGNQYYVTCTLHTYYAGISGVPMRCESNSPFTFSAVTNVPSPTYSWTNTASCWTATGGTTSANVTYSTTSTCNGVLGLVVGGDGCPNNSGTTISETVGDGSLNETQTGLIGWSRAGISCQFDASVATVPGATSYQWSQDGSTVFATTSGPKTTGGDFDYSTLYHIWVRVLDACSSSYGPWSAEHSQTTPGKPPGCAQEAIKPMEEGYKVYPNPASNQLTIEYPAVSDNSALSLSIYDMLGHKMASWNLPSTETTATENISALPTGMYLYIINSGDNIVMRGKVMVQK
jgi:hypothetical protein